MGVLPGNSSMADAGIEAPPPTYEESIKEHSNKVSDENRREHLEQTMIDYQWNQICSNNTDRDQLIVPHKPANSCDGAARIGICLFIVVIKIILIGIIRVALY